MNLSLLFWVVMLLALLMGGLSASNRLGSKIPSWSGGLLYWVALACLGWEVFGSAIKR